MSESGYEAITAQFGLQGSDVEFLLEGWSTPEEGFRWAVGSQCSGAARIGCLVGARIVVTPTLAGASGEVG
jgi:hypothetical protein